MRNNPFIPQSRNPIVEQNQARWRFSEPVSEARAYDDSDRLRGGLSPQHRTKRFARCVCLGSALFLIIVFFVFREMQHYRELYRMSLLVATAEAQTRQWQERQRMEEAQKAGLLAELHRQQFSTGDPQVIKAAYVLPNRRY
jgi:hypothetical protein